MNLFLNDQLLAPTAASPLCFDRGLLLGDGLFETIRAENNTLLFFEAHYERLKQGALALAIDFTLSALELKNRCHQLLAANHLETTIASVRTTLTRGCAERGIDIPKQQNPTLLIQAAAYTNASAKPKSVYITDIIRNEYSPIIRLKTTNYLELILAKKQAVDRGYDDGLMLNTQGAITELSTANIFVVIEGAIITPPLKDGVLPGIMRQEIITASRQVDIDILEKTLYPEDLLTASECFSSNSLIEIQPILSINEHRFATGTEAIVTQRVIDAYIERKESHFS
ncbi:MAG: branched-chain amino acid aminotransferase [Gammaproteobacteria bacterium]|nr:branched-chain amino acid aminotransferase [Gammaproteobacteria bacterium]